MALTSYTVMVPTRLTGREAQDRTQFLSDRFAWAALVMPFVYCLWHRLWIEAALVLLIDVALGLLVMVLQVGEGQAFAMFIAVRAAIAWEATNIRRYALERRGYREAAILHARTLEEAEARFFASLPVAGPVTTVSTPIHASGIIGLFPDAGPVRGL